MAPRSRVDPALQDTALDDDAVPAPVDAQRSVGVVAPYDFALDRELWRWAPAGVTLHLTRTPYEPLPVGVAQALAVGEAETVARCTRDLSVIGPEVVAYACNSGSFARGRAGERELCAAIREAGAPAAVTASGALAVAVRVLGIGAIAVATPYDDHVAGRLVSFLAECGVTVTRNENLGLTGRIWTVPPEDVADLVRRTAAGGGDAVFLSCTNLAAYDLIPRLEAELGTVVLTANQLVLWAALGAIGLPAVGPGQGLLRFGYPAGEAA